MEALSAALFLSVANKAIVDWIVGPVKKKFPNLDMWWLVYVALVTGGVIGWISQANVFAAYMPDVLTGRILTAILVGGGSSLIHDIFDKK
jgi:hypothetical protein